MEPTDNPYDILGVPESATARDIRTAYRRLALEHHPDRNPTGGGGGSEPQPPPLRSDSTKLFAKINHAYEVLTDPEAQRSWNEAASAQRTREEHYRQQPQQPQYYFHDPFAVFESVFREDFGRDFLQRGQQHHHHHHQGMFRDSPLSSSFFFGGRDPFDDPFFQRQQGGMNQHWPFSSFSRPGGLDDGFFARGVDDLFRSTMEDATRKHHHHHDQQGPTTSSSFYSSSTVSRRNERGEWVTETTENRNGHVTTERITRDGHGNIVQHETIENGQNDNTGERRRRPELPPAATLTNASPPTTATTATTKNSSSPNNRFRLPWRRGNDDE